jgi:glycerol-1-phosphate dehydrogenase [NAD(P)+]
MPDDVLPPGAVRASDRAGALPGTEGAPPGLPAADGTGGRQRRSAGPPGSGAEGWPFRTVFGRGLVEELPIVAPPPYLVVTMADLWPRFEPALREGLAAVWLVDTLEIDAVAARIGTLPDFESIIGLGGGQAIDVAKFVAWRTRRPLFQVPTAMTVNAPFGHRAGLRRDGIVRYVGFAVPEAVYVDIDVIRSAPAALNRSGIGDILCYRTAHVDWALARDLGREEARWPYDPALVAAARARLDTVLDDLDEIRAVSERGIRTLMGAHRWGGATFHDSGWNPRHIEGVEHFLFYNLERRTGRHFIHGQPVGLGVYAGAVLQDDTPDDVLRILLRAGVDVRPAAMGVSWDDVGEALRTLGSFVREAGLWFTVADVRPVDEALVRRIRDGVEDAYAGWEDGS